MTVQEQIIRAGFEGGLLRIIPGEALEKIAKGKEISGLAKRVQELFGKAKELKTKAPTQPVDKVRAGLEEAIRKSKAETAGAKAETAGIREALGRSQWEAAGAMAGQAAKAEKLKATAIGAGAGLGAMVPAAFIAGRETSPGPMKRIRRQLGL